MSSDNLVIEHLRAIRTGIAAVKTDTIGIRRRLGSIDSSVVDMRRSVVHLSDDMAHQQLTMDKLLDRVQRIKNASTSDKRHRFRSLMPAFQAQAFFLAGCGR